MAPVASTNEFAKGNISVNKENYLIADDLLQARAADEIQIPLLCFQQSERGIIDFEGFTGRDIDRFVDHAAKSYLNHGLQPVGSHILIACMTSLSNLIK